MTMPSVFAGDPAPQQLTAPCRKYSGRLHPPIEQAMYRWFSMHLRGSIVLDSQRQFVRRDYSFDPARFRASPMPCRAMRH